MPQQTVLRIKNTQFGSHDIYSVFYVSEKYVRKQISYFLSQRED
jgi:hypothetical protein